MEIPMSLEIVRQVNGQHPDLLQTNIGATCYQFTLHVIERLRADGHEAYSMCKSPGEGQYVPPGFQPRDVIGLDGKPHRCSGVSHDAIWCDGKQVDTIAGANENDQFIYRKSTEPFWSFDPADGQKIVGVPIWNGVPEQHWRPNNPPLKDGAVTPQPTPPPSVPTYPSYESLGGDEGGKAITRQLDADFKRAGRPGLDADCGAWQQRVSYDFLTGICKTVEESIAKHRKEWCDVLGIDVRP
jgi:hypothetical protein